MTTFSYTTGNPSNLVGGGTANMTDIGGSLTDLKTYINGGNIGVGNIAPNGVTAALIEAQQTWQTVALGGGGTGWSPANISYYKDSLGIVHLRGDSTSFSGGTVAIGATIATLPAGYRPGVNQVFAIFRRDVPSSLVSVMVRTDGVLIIDQAMVSGSGYTFGGIHFRAEL